MSRDVLQFDTGDGRCPTTITCLVGAEAITVDQKRKLKLAVTTCIAPNANAIMK